MSKNRLMPQSLQKSQKDTKVPMPFKKASAKILTDYGYTVREITKITGLGMGTVMRLKAKDRLDISEIDAEVWHMAEQGIKKVLTMKRDLLSAKVLKAMEGKIDEGKAPLGTLAFVYKVLRESDMPKNGPNSGNTINNIVVKVQREQADSIVGSVIQGEVVPK